MTLKRVGSNQTELHLTTCTLFFSYDTPVAAWVPGKGYLRTDRYYSRTTSKHITQWLGGCEATTVPQAAIDALACDDPIRQFHEEHRAAHTAES